MPAKRPNEPTNEPTAPATIPGEPLDPRIPDEVSEGSEEKLADGRESAEERHSRESERAFDQAIVRLPPG